MRLKPFEYRDYQKKIINQGTGILLRGKLLYLAMEVRTGKTLTSLGICDNLYINRVLFITKKKAISSIENDYRMLLPNYELEVINYESLHKIKKRGWDVIICDEAHSMGAYPKPSKRAKQVKELIQINDPYYILLSGTPTPESYSQMYHQVYGHPENPFKKYTTFYKFARLYVNITLRYLHGFNTKDYSEGTIGIVQAMKPFTISYTQKQAGYKVETKETILTVPMSKETYKLCTRLKKDLVIQGKDQVILADTGVKLMSKLHQMYSGTVKFESGKSMVIDSSKAKFIKRRFKDKKIGIFYKFTAELKALQEEFGDEICTELEEFKNTKKHIALQIVSGREGISLKEADCLVYYNIDFSATSYWQSRDRMTTKDRLKNDIYWIFSKDGIERQIYKAVSKKKDYTLQHFKSDFLSL
jgi:SNF2 family DNA or RNA helicase